MKNIVIITMALTIITSTISLSAYTRKINNQTQQSAQQSSNLKRKPKKPEYYQGHSFGLQNYPGKTIDPGANTGMLPTNSSSPLMGNDITF